MFLNARNHRGLDDEIIKDLKFMFDMHHNPYAKSFRMANDRFHVENQPNVILKLIGRRDKDGRTYNLPTASEVATCVVSDVRNFDRSDIIV